MNRWAHLLIGVIMLLYVVAAVTAHLSLRTNAFDLSMFDYALWSSLHGRLGFVPFVGHSIFSEHLMPALLLILPIYATFQDPITLIAVQIVAVWLAGIALVRFMKAQNIAPPAIILAAAFLLSRPSFRAITSFFYPECLQPALVFACILTWRARRTWLYWLCLAALLATKEDIALFVMGFAAVQFFSTKDRRVQAVMTVLVAVVWLFAAMTVALPFSRHADGLNAANPFLEARYASSDNSIRIGELAVRLGSMHSLSVLLNLLGTFGFLSLMAPEWLIPIVPGLLLNLAARPETLQASITGHYVWPFLPWLAVAAVVGFGRLYRTHPRVATIWCAALAVFTLADSPIFRSADRFIVSRSATAALLQLPAIGSLDVAAQNDLLPHLPHSTTLTTIGLNTRTQDEHDMVVLTTIGDTWPLTQQQVKALVDGFSREPGYRRISNGPLFIFRRTQ